MTVLKPLETSAGKTRVSLLGRKLFIKFNTTVQWQCPQKLQGWYNRYSLGNVINNRILSQESLPLGSWSVISFSLLLPLSLAQTFFLLSSAELTPVLLLNAHTGLNASLTIWNQGRTPCPYSLFCTWGTSEGTPSFFTWPKGGWRPGPNHYPLQRQRRIWGQVQEGYWISIISCSKEKPTGKLIKGDISHQLRLLVSP